MALTGGTTRCGPVLLSAASSAIATVSLICLLQAAFPRLGCRESEINDSEGGEVAGSERSNHTPIIVERPASFLSRLRAEAWPTWSVHDADTGKYKSCGSEQKILWFHLGGNFRTMDKHTINTLSFLDQSHSCWFVVAFLRHEREYGRDGDRLGDALRSLQPRYQHRLAFAVTERRHKASIAEVNQLVDKISDTWPGLVMLSRAVSQAHGILLRESDVLVISRPDMIFSHSIQFSSLSNLALRPKRFMLLVRHDAEIGGFDPTETFAVSTRGVFEALCEPTRRLPCKGLSSKECQVATCRPDIVFTGCGHPYRMVLTMGSQFLGAEVYYITTKFKIHFHRLNGDYTMAVNRPGNTEMAKPTAKVLPPLDITKDVTCEFATLGSCKKDASAKGPSSAQGVPTRLHSFPFMNGRSYLCTRPADL